MGNRKRTTLCMMLCFLLGMQAVYSQIAESTLFHLQGSSYQITPKTGASIKANTQISLDVSKPIVALGLSGNLYMEADDSYVRITLRDMKDKEYLVYETYPLLSGGYHETWESVAMESVDLGEIMPQSLKIEIYKSTLQLSDIAIQEGATHDTSKEQFKLQEDEIVATLNRNISRQKLLWKAGKTSASTLTYEKKKALMGNNPPFFYGFEFYRGGIFSFPGSFKSKSLVISDDSCFVKRFDWRDRHGRNWITCPKMQQGFTCWTFGPVSALEAKMNIFFNDTINYDLSEQNLVSCVYPWSVQDHYDNGGFSSQALNHVRDRGIVLESCFPFQGVVSCGEKCDCPSEIVSISSYASFLGYAEKFDKPMSDWLKKSVINSPVVVDYLNLARHCMCCVGFYLLSTPDTIYTDVYFGNDRVEQIDSTSVFFNNWIWIMKNSLGTNWGEDGFCRVVFPDNLELRLHRIDGDISSLVLSEKDRLVTDEDGDGCFVWGGGQRPSFLPSYAGLFEDGDDSNPIIGEMNEYGICQTNSMTRHNWIISTNSVINRNCIVKAPEIIVSSGGTLYIDDVSVVMRNNVNITVCNGGCLCISSGCLKNVSIHVESGGELSITNNGKIILYQGGTLRSDIGSLIDITHGVIKR